MDDIVTYSEGICYKSVCSALPQAETIEAVNQQLSKLKQQLAEPTKSGWALAKEPFATGEANPCPCNDEPDRQHFLFEWMCAPLPQ